MLNVVATLLIWTPKFSKLLGHTNLLRVFLALTLRKEKVCLNFRGFPLMLRLSKPDFKVFFSIYGHNEFQFIQSILQKNVEKKVLIIDGGAFNGLSSRFLCELGPHVEVLAIEPSAENFGYLQFNTRHCQNLSTFNRALASNEDQLDLYDRGTGSWGYSLIPSSVETPYEKLNKTKGITILELVHGYSDYYKILKLDIEGGEYDLLLDSRPWIDHFDIIFAELHPQVIPEISALWYQATSDMQQVYLGTEKVCAVRHM